MGNVIILQGGKISFQQMIKFFWAPPETHALRFEVPTFIGSSDPESHPKVGFESVSGFGFRRLKPTFAVGFGFRVSSLETNFRCRFRVSGFGFRRLKPTFAVGFGFRVSGFDRPWGSSVFRVGFGFRVSIGPGEGKSSESVSGFGFRSVLGKLSLQSRFRVSGFAVRNQL